jgi:hypothetical protein
MTREERLNNPGGIEHERNVTWAGQSTSQPDPTFVSFSEPQWGIRAIARSLHTYQRVDGVKTLAQAISRWAPPAENNTPAYIADVCQRCGVNDDTEVDFDQIMPNLVRAIIVHENGECIYPDDLVNLGISLV